MKKIKHYPQNRKENQPHNYYDLKQEAVNDLVNALNEPNPQETKETKKPPMNPYKYDKIARIPTWIKAVFIKFWVAGAICFFFYVGLGYYVDSMENLILITALATGLIMDLLVTPAFLYFESDKKEYHKYLMVPVSAKKIWSLLINIPIAFIEVYGVVMIYAIINEAYINSHNVEEGYIALGVEPLLYGVFFVIIDLILLFFKNMIVGIVNNAKNVSKNNSN
jgi:hypothetical protein